MARVIEQAGVSVAPTGSTGVQVNEFEAAIKSVTSSATVGAVFVYDTRNDSDGGAWRKKCAGLSWYDEALNQTTRGGRREFPSVAVIVVDNETSGSVYGTVTIYDGDDPSLPMWRVYNNYVNNSMTGIYALNGRVYVTAATTTQGGGLYYLDFVNDFSARQTDTTSNTAWNHYVQLANSTYQTTPSFWGGRLVNISVNDVAATVLEGAEIGALGLPIPTIAVACAAGTSVIHANGNVYNVDGGGNFHKNVSWDDDNTLFMQLSSNSTHTNLRVERKLLGQLYADSALANDSFVLNLTNSSWTATGAALGVSQTAFSNAGKNKFAQGGPSGLHLWKRAVGFDALNSAEPPNLNAYITSTYNTGYMLGDIRFATTTTLTANLSNGANVFDQSVKGNTLTVNAGSGSYITRTKVATDAEMSAFGNFSASNYLSRASDTDFDFGTGDFSISLWVKNTNWTGTQRLLGRSQDSNTKRLSIYASGTTLYAYIKDTTTKSASADVLKNNVWQHVFAFRRGSVLYLFVDGKLVNSVTGADSINITPASNGMLVIGSETFDNGSTIESTALVNGSLSLIRISATAPTPQQVKEIYEAEKPLFRAGAKCLLLSSSTVSDLAYDKGTDLLYVSTEAIGLGGGNVFRGLESIDTIDSKTTFGHSAASVILSNITAANGIVAVGSEAHAGVNLPAIDVRGDINTADTKLPDDGKLHFTGVTTDATPTVIGFVPISENERYTIRSKVSGQMYQDNDSYFIDAEEEKIFYRDIGSDVSFRSTNRKLVNESLSTLDVEVVSTTGGSDSPASVAASDNYVMIKVTGRSGTRMQWNAEVEVQRITEKTYER